MTATLCDQCRQPLGKQLPKAPNDFEEGKVRVFVRGDHCHPCQRALVIETVERLAVPASNGKAYVRALGGALVLCNDSDHKGCVNHS